MYGIRMLEQVGTWWKEGKEFLALFTELWGTYNGATSWQDAQRAKTWLSQGRGLSWEGLMELKCSSGVCSAMSGLICGEELGCH